MDEDGQLGCYLTEYGPAMDPYGTRLYSDIPSNSKEQWEIDMDRTKARIIAGIVALVTVVSSTIWQVKCYYDRHPEFRLQHPSPHSQMADEKTLQRYRNNAPNLEYRTR